MGDVLELSDRSDEDNRTEETEHSREENASRIASFDIGTTNFAHYIEEFNKDDLDNLASTYDELPRSLQRRVKGPMNDKIQDILDGLFVCGTCIDMGVKDIRSEEFSDGKGFLDIATRKILFKYLKNLKSHLDTCTEYIVEQQYFNTYSPAGKKKYGSEANVNAIKIAEDLVSWLLLQYPDKEVCFFSSNFKTHMLGAPEGLTKPQRKKWSIQTAKRIFELREDEEGISAMTRKGKKDDVADACTQCQAYKYKKYVGKF